jgi:hypothetical protein
MTAPNASAWIDLTSCTIEEGKRADGIVIERKNIDKQTAVL